MMKHRDKRFYVTVLGSMAIGAGIALFLLECPAAAPLPAVAASPPAETAAPAPPAAVDGMEASVARLEASVPSRKGGAAAPSPYLANEEMFRSTLRDCLGSACFTATPQGAGVDARVALLAPPSPAARELWRWYRNLVGAPKKPTIDWVETAAAPPYGYGKNHGYTRIVRLALPLAGSVAAVSNDTALAPKVLAQHVRWHCRVSHVAAHTAMLTVEPLDFASFSDRRRAAERLLSFVGLKVSHDMLNKAEKTFAPVQAALAAATAAATELNGRANVAASLEAALAAELKATNTLQAWPCKSLWVDKRDAVLGASAKALAPDCAAPFTTCSVARDKAEAAGNSAPEPL